MAWWLWPLVQLVLCCSTGVVALLWWKWANRLVVDAPGPPTLPIIGNILHFKQVPVTLKEMVDYHRQYGDLASLYVGPLLMIIVVHPDDVKQVLLTSKLVDRDPLSGPILRMFIGDGLLSLNGHRWKEHRKLINPTFHSELLEGFLEPFHTGGLFLSERLARTQGAATEIHSLALMAALRTICSAALGIDPDLVIPDTLSEEEASAAMSNALDTFQKVVLKPWLHSKFLLQLTSAGRALFKYLQILQDGIMKCIALRSAAKEEGPKKTRLRLLEALVKPGGETMMPVSELRDELMHVIAAGVGTTAGFMSYVLTSLALHPEWQDAAHKELRDVFGEGDEHLRAATLADLGSLRVLDSIIKETLRLFPMAPLIPRMASEDLWLSGGRVLVPKGAVLLIMPHLTHRLPQFFSDPLRFDPSRFLEGRDGKEHPGSYLPFGLGARNCVGSQYARLQLKVFLADILRRFRFLPHSRWEDLEDSVLSVGLNMVKPIKVKCVPLHDTST